MNVRVEGWGDLVNAKRAHYFRAGRSLCRRWWTLGGPMWSSNQALGDAPGKGTCAACWRKRAKEESDAATSAL